MNLEEERCKEHISFINGNTKKGVFWTAVASVEPSIGMRTSKQASRQQRCWMPIEGRTWRNLWCYYKEADANLTKILSDL